MNFWRQIGFYNVRYLIFGIKNNMAAVKIHTFGTFNVLK